MKNACSCHRSWEYLPIRNRRAWLRLEPAHKLQLYHHHVQTVSIQAGPPRYVFHLKETHELLANSLHAGESAVGKSRLVMHSRPISTSAERLQSGSEVR